MEKKYDVLSIGNPLLDLIVEVDELFLQQFGLKKGGMHLINAEQSAKILSALRGKKIEQMPGGSSANVAANVCTLGGSSAFIGSIGKDEHGKIYKKMSKQYSVAGELIENNEPTGHAITLITPDFQRTFATFLGSALKLEKKNIDEELIKDCKFLHVEIYQFDTKNQEEAALYAMEVAKENEVLVSLDLANFLFVKSKKDFVEKIIAEYVDVLFMNQQEAEALTGEKDPVKAADKVKELCNFFVITFGKEGSIVYSNGREYNIPVCEVEEVNTTGAGDMYLAGILYVAAQGLGMATAGKIASYAAAQVVASVGPRLDRELKDEIRTL